MKTEKREISTGDDVEIIRLSDQLGINFIKHSALVIVLREEGDNTWTNQWDLLRSLTCKSNSGDLTKMLWICEGLSRSLSQNLFYLIFFSRRDEIFLQ